MFSLSWVLFFSAGQFFFPSHSFKVYLASFLYIWWLYLILLLKTYTVVSVNATSKSNFPSIALIIGTHVQMYI